MDKRCSKCKETKSSYEFKKCKITKSGLYSHCKLCEKKYRETRKDKQREYRKKYHIENRERLLVEAKKYRENNQDIIQKYRKDNKERIKKIQKNYYSKNQEKHKKYLKEYKKRNKGKINSLNAKRRAQKKKATPNWANLKLIEQFYNNCPDGHQVDHIYPLQNDNCCGLHILINLQYLSIKDNQSKSNKMPEEL